MTTTRSLTKSHTAQTKARRRSRRRVGWIRRLVADIVFVTKRDNKWWVLPLVIFLLVLAALLVFAALAGPLAPFLYPLL